jgi:hypothetical protein
MLLATLGWLGAKFGAPDTLTGPLGEWYVLGALGAVTLVLGIAAFRPSKNLALDEEEDDLLSTPEPSISENTHSEPAPSPEEVPEEEAFDPSGDDEPADEEAELPGESAQIEEPAQDAPGEAAESVEEDIVAPEEELDASHSTEVETPPLADAQPGPPQEEDPDRTMDLQSALLSEGFDLKSLADSLPPGTLNTATPEAEEGDDEKPSTKGKPSSLQARLKKLKKNLDTGTPEPASADVPYKSKLRGSKFDSPTKQVQGKAKLPSGGAPFGATRGGDVDQTQVHKVGRDLLNRARAAYDADGTPQVKHNLPTNPYTEGVGETSAEEMNQLWQRFVNASGELGRDLSKLDPTKFLDQIQRNYDAICARFNCTRVTFSVRIKDGRVALKATPDIR